MGIKNIVVNPTGLVGVNPSIIYIDTDDTAAEVLATGYLTQAKQIYGNVFSEKQLALVNTTSGVGLYQVSISNDGQVSLQARLNPGSTMIFGTTAAYAGGGTSHAFTVAGLTSSSIVTANILTSANAVAIAKPVPTTDTLTVTFTADPGAGTTVNYIAIIPQ
jgi:hypothetical protein